MAKKNIKDKLFTIKVSDDEIAEWRKIADLSSITMAEFVRIFFAKQQVLKVAMPPRKVDPALLREIGAIGNNLNQMSRKLNQGQKLDVLIRLNSIEGHLKQLVKFEEKKYDQNAY